MAQRLLLMVQMYKVPYGYITVCAIDMRNRVNHELKPPRQGAEINISSFEIDCVQCFCCSSRKLINT